MTGGSGGAHRERRAKGRERTLLASGVLAVLAVPGPLTGQPAWEVADASVTFEIRNAGLPVRGRFEGLEAAVCFDPARPETGSLRGSIDPATIETGIGLRDRHLQRREYFHVERYGEIELGSIRLRRSGEAFAGAFLLRIRDVEREVEIAFSFGGSGSRARLSGHLALDRLEYGLGRRSLILGDEVTVEVALELVPAADGSPDPCHRPRPTLVKRGPKR